MGGALHPKQSYSGINQIDKIAPLDIGTRMAPIAYIA